MTKQEFIQKLLADSDYVRVKRGKEIKPYFKADHGHRWEKIGDWILREFEGTSLTKSHKTYTPMFERFNEEGFLIYEKTNENKHTYKGNNFRTLEKLEVMIQKEVK